MVKEVKLNVKSKNKTLKLCKLCTTNSGYRGKISKTSGSSETLHVQTWVGLYLKAAVQECCLLNNALHLQMFV